MKQAKVHLGCAVELNGKPYIGGRLSHRAEKKFIEDAADNGVLTLHSDTIYRVSKVTDPEDSETLYGNIEPLDGYDNYRKFIQENHDLVSKCILDRQMIFPYMMESLPPLYTVQLCGTPLVDRATKNKEIEHYVRENSITPQMAFTRNYAKENSKSSLVAIRKDIRVVGETKELEAAITFNIAATTRYRMLLMNFSDTRGLIDAMVSAYKVVNSMRDTILTIRNACLGSDRAKTNIRNLADAAYDKLCSDCTAVCFADNEITLPPYLEPYGANNYFFLEPERITPETIEAINAVVAAFGETLRDPSIKNVTVKKKSSSEKTKKSGKNDTKKQEKPTKTKEAKEKKGENENGKESK